MEWVRLFRALDRSSDEATGSAGRYGWPANAPYDRILVSASAQEVPSDLVEQLTPAGRMVIPVQSEMLVVVPDGRGGWTSTSHGSYRFVRLR